MNIDSAHLSPADQLRLGLADRADQISAPAHAEIVHRVIGMYQAAKRDQRAAARPYQPAGEWASYIAERGEFYEAMERGDEAVCGRKLRNFWRNELGPIVKEYAKFEQLAEGRDDSIQRFTRGVMRNYSIWRNLFDGRPADLQVPAVGNPWGCMIDAHLVVPKATRFHALASQISDLTRPAAHPVVVEIGGGYAGAAYYLLRDRPALTYIDLDLPETLVLAAYYLLSCFPERPILLYGEAPLPEAERLKNYAAVLLPNFELPKLTDRCADVFFNSFSFSEMPYETLKEYLHQVQRIVNRYFLHNNMDRVGVVNRGFERIPASAYPLLDNSWLRLYKRFDLFHGSEGDYREFLYERCEAA